MCKARGGMKRAWKPRVSWCLILLVLGHEFLPSDAGEWASAGGRLTKQARGNEHPWSRMLSTPINNSAPRGSQCDAFDSNPGNPIGLGWCPEADVRKVGMTDTITVFDYSTNPPTQTSQTTAEFIGTATSGGCIRVCDGSITSTEVDKAGNSVKRPLSIMMYPPVIMLTGELVGWVPQAARTINIPRGQVDTLAMSVEPGTVSDPVYMASLSTVLRALGHAAGQARRLGAQDNIKRRILEGVTPPPVMHPNVSAVLKEAVESRYKFLRISQRLAKNSKQSPTAWSLYDMLSPDTGSFFLSDLMLGDSHLTGLPIDDDIWEETRFLGSVVSRLEYAQALQVPGSFF